MHLELDVKDFNGYQLLGSSCCSPIMGTCSIIMPEWGFYLFICCFYWGWVIFFMFIWFVCLFDLHVLIELFWTSHSQSPLPLPLPLPLFFVVRVFTYRCGLFSWTFIWLMFYLGFECQTSESWQSQNLLLVVEFYVICEFNIYINLEKLLHCIFGTCYFYFWILNL